MKKVKGILATLLFTVISIIFDIKISFGLFVMIKL